MIVLEKYVLGAYGCLQGPYDQLRSVVKFKFSTMITVGKVQTFVR